MSISSVPRSISASAFGTALTPAREVLSITERTINRVLPVSKRNR
jgi:hypothetical protein